MVSLLAHAEQALEPHDVWTAWTFDPVVLLVLAAAAVAYRRGWREGPDTPARRMGFWGAIAAITVALMSPLDAMSGVLVSAHMVQHVLLVLVAAPLLALSAPVPALLRGTPLAVRGGARTARRAAGLNTARLQRLRSPVGRWLLYVVTLWLWHASVVYGAAVEHALVHALEHATFLASAALVWSAILGPARVRVSRGLGLLGVFALGLQGIFLSVLLTFARQPYYAEYLSPPAAWGLDPLTDQQLAGVLMWIPAGLIHTGVALYLLVSWLREHDQADDLVPAPQPSA
jgi:putative membrane protein